MKYCQSCGKQIEDGAKFCVNCGSNQSAVQQSAAIHRNTGGHRLHCPKCKSNRLSPIVETTATGGTAVHTPITRRTGFTTYTANSVHRNYWLCQDCGHKFRNLENLKEELTRETKQMKVGLVFSVLFGVLSLFLVILLTSEPMYLVFLSVPTFCVFIMLIVFLCIWLFSRANTKRLTAEKEYLEKNCFG